MVHLHTNVGMMHIQGALRAHMLDGIFISVVRVKLSEGNALIFCTFIPHGRKESNVL